VNGPDPVNTKKNAMLKQEAANDAHPEGTRLGHYILGKSLGKGTFGKVKMGTHTLTEEKVAIKILEKSRIKDKKDIERISREIKILKKVRHPNVI
jgi:serine/threonine protein kinase